MDAFQGRKRLHIRKNRVSLPAASVSWGVRYLAVTTLPKLIIIDLASRLKRRV